MSPLPWPLRIAVGVVLVEALLVLGYAVFGLVHLNHRYLLVGISAAIFFMACAAGIGVCARGVMLRRPWSRSPIVVVQLILIGMAWSGRNDSEGISVLLTVLAVVVLIGMLHPRSVEVLNREEHGG